MKYFLATVTKSLAPLFQWGKGLFFRGIYERIIDCFGSSCNKCRFQRFVRDASKFLFTRGLVLVGSLWVSFCPLVLKAEFDSNDSSNLNYINSNVQQIRASLEQLENGLNGSNQTSGWLYTRLKDIEGELSWLETISGRLSPYSGWNLDAELDKIQTYLIGLGYTSENTLKDDLLLKNQSLESKLDEIITALENLKDSGAGGSGETTINETWLTEDTFKTDFGGFVDKYDTFLNSWGFSAGSGETLKSYLDDKFNFKSRFDYKKSRIYLSSSDPSPFPDNNQRWPYLASTSYSVSGDTWIDAIIGSLFAASDSQQDLFLYTSKKHAWNDWQAHTNLISRLDHIFNLDDKSDLSFNEETGQLTLKEETGGSGSGNVVTDLRPVSTNSVDTAVQAVTNSTSRIAGIYDKEEIENRYLNDELLLVGSNYGIGEQQGSIAAGNLVTPWFTIDFNVWGQSYRNALTIDRLNSWRTVAGYIWTLASVVLCVILVRRWGNM